jgi:hypothetical protein
VALRVLPGHLNHFDFKRPDAEVRSISAAERREGFPRLPAPRQIVTLSLELWVVT